MDTHPENKGGQFTVTLHNALFLDSSWEVGLAEAIYRRDWPNVRKDENYITCVYPSKDFLEAAKEMDTWNKFLSETWEKGLIKQGFTFSFMDYDVREERKILAPSGTSPPLFLSYMNHIKQQMENGDNGGLKIESFDVNGEITATIPRGFIPDPELKRILGFPKYITTFIWKVKDFEIWNMMKTTSSQRRFFNLHIGFDTLAKSFCDRQFSYTIRGKDYVTKKSPGKTQTREEVKQYIIEMIKEMNKNLANDVGLALQIQGEKLSLTQTVFAKADPERDRIDFKVKSDPLHRLFHIQNVIVAGKSKLVMPTIPIDFHTAHWPTRAVSEQEKYQYGVYKEWSNMWRDKWKDKLLFVSEEGGKKPHSVLVGDKRFNLPELFTAISKMFQSISPDIIFTTEGDQAKIVIPEHIKLIFNEGWTDLGLAEYSYGHASKHVWTAPIAKNWPKQPAVYPLPMEKGVVELTPSHYASKEDLIKEFTFKLNELGEKAGIDFKFNEKENNVFINLSVTPKENSMARYWWKLHMSQSLSEQLGINRTKVHGIIPRNLPEDVSYNYKAALELGASTLPFSIKGDRPFDLNRGMDTLWLYTDLVEPQRVGDREVSLLRIIPTRGDHWGETVVLNYERAQYLNLTKTSVASIPVEIFNTYGLKPIEFASDVILKLHFRKKTI